jgi:hypothetical protein
MAKNQEQVVLIGATIWKHGDVFLSAMTEDVPSYIPKESVSEADLPAVELAVKEGILAFSKNVSMTLGHAKAREDKKGQEPLVSAEFTGRLEWKDQMDVAEKDLKRPPKSPSIATRSAVYTDRKSKAFKILQATAKHLMKTLPGEVGQFTKDDDRAKFLRELEYIESQGYNNTGEPRTSVAHLISRLLEPFNEDTMSMSPVVSFSE